jgi:hypothetical protein
LRILGLGSEYGPLLRHIEIGFLSAAALAECVAFPPECIWSGISRFLVPSSSALDSANIRDFPDIFAEFRGKQFSLLWRGSRDGFGSRDFHRRCHGHANTLTLIEDTDGNIFGGFTPVEWDLPWISMSKADPSGKSFLFTLKNPHNVPARRFALKAEEKDVAIYCRAAYGPTFHGGIGVWDKCNANTASYTEYFGNSDTGLDEKTFFTGSKNFQVKEIEVFEITD